MTTAALAAAAARTTWAAAPPDVRDRVVDLVVDCVAVAALGSRRPELQQLVRYHGESAPAGAATVVGSDRGWSSSAAAFLNGCSVAADQLQDGHRSAKGHPASHVVPAVLAVAEEHDLGGADVLSSVLAGYEAGVRVGRAMGGTPEGVHDIGTWGQVGVSVAVARLLAPGDPHVAHMALELSSAAVLLTDARTVFAGATGSHAFLGASIQHGMTLGIAAVAGLAAQPGALERHVGAVASRGWDAERLQDAVNSHGEWDAYEVLQGYVKVHPTCAHLHGINDAVQDLLDDGLTADDVLDVEVRTTAATSAFDGIATNELAARFSVPTTVAVAMVSGRLDETTMVDETVSSRPVTDLARRVRVVHDRDLDAGYPAGRPAKVDVVLRDGRRLSASSDRPRGDADRALDRKALSGKASRLLSRRFGSQGEAVLHAVHALAEDGTARHLGQALRSAAAGTTS
jgi:2-methylcitrate dehydratase PrpD